MGRKRKAGKPRLPSRWDLKHGAYYYRPRDDERHLFNGQTWFLLGYTYPDALRAFADRRELDAGDTLDAAIDRYTLEVLPGLKPNTRSSYEASLARLRATLGHNPMRLIGPQLVYQHLDAVAKAKGMNSANNDLKVYSAVERKAIRWGIIAATAISGEVRYFGERDGLRKTGGRYVEDWELVEWAKVAKPYQQAFAAMVLLIGTRKCDTLRLQRSDAKDGVLMARATKTDTEHPFIITPALQQAIDFALSVQRVPSFWLIPNSEGQCFVDGDTDRCASFDRAWRQTMERAVAETGLQRAFTAKDLRAKVSNDQDNIERAREILGHTSSSMTRKHYSQRKRPVRPAK